MWYTMSHSLLLHKIATRLLYYYSRRHATIPNSNEIHTACLAIMRLLKASLELTLLISSRHCPIASVFCSRHLRREYILDLLRIVVVPSARAHVVRIWVLF